MNMNDGKRVHEKLGADRIMYNLTGLIVVLGFYEWLRVVFTLAVPGWKTFLTITTESNNCESCLFLVSTNLYEMLKIHK